MANPGRVRTAKIAESTFTEVIVELVGNEADATRWFPYGQTNSRRVPIWSEMWRLRVTLHDFLQASGGYMHCEKDVERCVRLAHVQILKSAGKRAASMDEDTV